MQWYRVGDGALVGSGRDVTVGPITTSTSYYATVTGKRKNVGSTRRRSIANGGNNLKVVFDHDFIHTELDWIGVDAVGVLGYFSTAGSGPIPANTARKSGIFRSLPEDVLALQSRGDAIQHQAAEWDISEWLDVARRGLFAYDWNVEKRRYDLIARPSSPLALKDLTDARLMRLGRAVVFPIRFAQVTSFVIVEDDLRGEPT